MDSDFQRIVDSLAAERDLPHAVVIDSLEHALAVAMQREYLNKKRKEVRVEVIIDPQTYERTTNRVWAVVTDEEFESEEYHIKESDAGKLDTAMSLGEKRYELLDEVPGNRIMVEAMRQTLNQKMRQAVASQIAERYRAQLGSLLTGLVKRVTGDSIFVELEPNVEGRLPRRNLIDGEIYKVGDRVRAVLHEIEEGTRTAQLILTRQGTQILEHLFRIEVPEISDGTITVHGLAREPGMRSKIAVRSGDGRVDPIGACIGIRGSRVQVVSNELGNERIDIIEWKDNVLQFVVNSMSLKETARIEVDEVSKSMDILVDEDDLAHAIGRNGQNVRLTSELTGWKLNVMTLDESLQKRKREREGPVQLFCKALEVDEEFAGVLLEEGFQTLNDLIDAGVEELAGVEGMDQNIAEELLQRAKKANLLKTLGDESMADLVQPNQDLLDLQDMELDVAYALARHSIVSLSDLADCSQDDLLDLEIPGLKPKAAADLVKQARDICWFSEEEAS